MKIKALAVTILCCVLSGAASFMPVVTMAYNKKLVTNVKNRVSKDYQPQGGRLGVFVVRPSVLVLETYDDNIFRDPDKDGDFITSVRPEVKVNSDWALHGVEAGAKGDFARYADFDSENYNDYSFYVSGRYDLDYETYVKVMAQYEKRHQERDALEDPGGDEPMDYHVKTVFIGFARELNLLRLNASATHRAYTHEDTDVAGATIDNGERDRKQQEFDIRLGYGLSDNYEVFGAVGYDRRRFDRADTPYRDSQSFNVRGGLAVNFTGKLRGDVYAGYARQSFNKGFDSEGLLNYGGSLLWNPTELTSVEARVGRELVETFQASAATIVQTTAEASVSHAVRENIIADVSAGLVDRDYRGEAGASNDNRDYKAGASVVYRVNQNVSAGLKYDYLDRNFDQSARDYDNNRVMLSLRYDY